MKISACIITFNEEENIHAACESVSWADEIVVVDSESTDATAEIARACGAKVLINKWPGFAKQKQFATDAAAHDWVFSLDADERVSPDSIINRGFAPPPKQRGQTAIGSRGGRSTWAAGFAAVDGTRIFNCVFLIGGTEAGATD